MTRLLTPAQEAERAFGGRVSVLRDAISGLLEAHLRGRGLASAQESFARAVGELQAVGDLFGRHRALLYASEPGNRSFGKTVDVAYGPSTFDAAVEQFSERFPALAEDAAAIRRVYDKNGFALVRSSDVKVTERIQDAITSGLREGLGRREVIRRILSEGVEAHFADWTQNYANLVHRNATTSAYASGVFQQMRDPAVQSVIPALQFDAIQDSARRKKSGRICTAFHGTVAPPGHMVWMKRTPGCHHGCRSTLSMRDRFSLESEGRMRDGAVVPYIPNQHVEPATGFGRRRDLEIYGPRV